MTATIEILRGELERLFSLDEMTSMSRKLLGLDPEEVGGATAKGSFAKALTERCVDGDRIEALVDVILVSRHEVDPRVRDIAALLGSDELPPKTVIGEYTIDRKIGSSDLGIVYMAQRKGKAYTLKTLRREAARDRRAVHRFLTANRLVATVRHEGLPQDIDAGELTTGVPGTQGIFFVAYEFIDAQPLSARFQRTGPQHLNELKTIFRGILEPLAALHKAQLVHGDLKLEHVLVSKGATPGQDGKIVLIDFGGDRLRPRLAAMNGGFGFLAVFGSPKTIAPEQVRGRTSDARTDVYSFGAMAYELLSGKPVFPVDSPTDAAFAHLANTPDVPSAKAPRGWIAREIDEWIMSMLAKDPAQRPRDAAALLETLDRLQRFATSKPGATKIAPEKVESLLGMLLAAPDDTESAIALEKAVDEGADPVRIATAFENAAQQMQVDTTDERETQKALLYRAARIFDSAARDKARAETIYAILLEMDPTDDIAMASLEQVRKALGKYNEIVEMLLTKSEAAAPGEDKARIMAEIGRLCAHELDDTEQALVAYTQALCEMPTDEEYASEVERFARQDAQRWSEVLASLTEAGKSEQLSMNDRNSALALVGRWYESKLARPDLALMAFQQILVTDPANEVAHEGLTVIYRRAQQWPELAGILLARADAAATTKARDLKSEAAELLESKLNDPYRAKEIYESILAEDPGHVRAGDAVARILERAGDFQNLVRLLEKRAEARRGPERAEALSRVAEVYEDHLNDLTASTERYEEALAIDPLSLTALKGLDRIFNRTGKYRELLEVLERQITVAATPRQKINLYERMASLHDEEFLDHASAAVALEEILKIDPANDAALTALARHYRALDKWEDAVKLYEKHASVTHDEARRIELVVSQARTLAEQVGSPERAIRAYEKVLQMSPGHAGALEALAHLRELSGDAHAALSAIEVLAGKAATPEAKAEQWMRAARLLEARGDRDGAIERYKLALEANPRDTAASAALRAAFAHRGDTASVVSLIERELSFAEGDLAKARLHAEMAKLYRDQIRDEPKADQMAKRALELDGSNAEALMVLGDLAYDNGRFLEAQKHYESLVNRAGVLSKEDAIRCCVRYVEAIGKSTSASAPGSQPGASVPPPSMSGDSVGRISVPPPSMRSPGNPKILAAVETLQKLAPTDPEVLARASRVVLEHGDATTARKMYEDLMARHSRTLAGADRAEALYGLGESTRRTGDLDAAIIPLREAATADPSNPAPLRALGKIYEAKENWPELLRTKKRRLDVAVGPERFDLLIEIGDVFFHRLNDRSMAGKTYVAALEERPDDRKLLTRLMQLYSEEKDWGKLVEVVLRLAEHVEDPKQRAKYMHTAAIVSARQLHDPDQAIKFYERALEYDPSLVKALEEAIDLRLAKNDHEGVENLLKMKLEQAKNVHDRVKLQETLDALGGLYQKFLNEPELAIDAYEAAHAFDPDNRDREALLAELYASDVTQYLDKAVKSQTQILRRNPYRVESYKLLRKLFTEAKKADAAWCLCQALSVLNLAEPDEERFYKRHKTENAAPAQAALDENDWARISHYDQDMLLTRIFAMIQPTIIRTRTQPLEQMGYDPRYALDLTMHPYPVSQTLYYAAGVFGMTPPMVLQNPNDPSGLGFLHAQQPAIVLGRAAFEGNVPNQQLAFIAGRHLSYFRPGFYVRHLVPTGTGLKAWLFAAIKLSVPQFPVAADLQGQVNEAMAAMQHEFQGAHRERLASVVSKLLQAGGNLDLKKWVASVDLTADRAGFLLAHDLGMATEVMRATEEGASVPVKERLKEVVLFSVSEEYFALREKLMITVDT